MKNLYQFLFQRWKRKLLKKEQYGISYHLCVYEYTNRYSGKKKWKWKITESTLPDRD